jgi:adenylate cyclase
MNTTRRLAAVLTADVVGYSRLMSVNEVATLQALKVHRREVVIPRLPRTTGVYQHAIACGFTTRAV